MVSLTSPGPYIYKSFYFLSNLRNNKAILVLVSDPFLRFSFGFDFFRKDYKFQLSGINLLNIYRNYNQCSLSVLSYLDILNLRSSNISIIWGFILF